MAEEKQTTTTTTVDATNPVIQGENNVPVDTEEKNAKLEGITKKEAQTLIEVTGAMGVVAKATPRIAKDANNEDVIVYDVVLYDVTDRQLEIISRKANICKWRDGITTVANRISTFTEDVADFAINGAAAPAVVSVAHCAGKVAPVVAKAAITMGVGIGTAAIHAGAETLTTAIQAGTRAYVELSNDDSMKQCKRELATLWGNISGKLFGASGKSKFARC